MGVPVKKREHSTPALWLAAGSPPPLAIPSEGGRLLLPSPIKSMTFGGRRSPKHSHTVKKLPLARNQEQNVEKQVVAYLAGRNVNWPKISGGKFGKSFKVWQKLYPQEFKSQD